MRPQTCPGIVGRKNERRKKAVVSGGGVVVAWRCDEVWWQDWRPCVNGRNGRRRRCFDKPRCYNLKARRRRRPEHKQNAQVECLSVRIGRYVGTRASKLVVIGRLFCGCALDETSNLYLNALQSTYKPGLPRRADESGQVR